MHVYGYVCDNPECKDVVIVPASSDTAWYVYNTIIKMAVESGKSAGCLKCGKPFDDGIEPPGRKSIKTSRNIDLT